MYPDLVYCTLMLACRSISADEGTCRRDVLQRIVCHKPNGTKKVYFHTFLRYLSFLLCAKFKTLRGRR